MLIDVLHELLDEGKVIAVNGMLQIKNNSLLLPLEKNVLPLRGTSLISHAPPFPF